MAEFCGMNCFCRELSETFTKTGELPSDIQLAVAEQVSVDKYTRLTLCGPFGCEIIKVVNKDGRVCIQTRGDEGTPIQEWPKGTKIKFEMTIANFEDWYACLRAAEIDSADDAPIKSDYFTVTPPKNEGDPWCIEPPESEGEDSFGAFEFKICGFRYFIKDGVWCRSPLPPSETSPDGLYTNPDVLIKDGCPQFRKSANQLSAKCGCCGKCGKEDAGIIKTESEPPLDGSEGLFWYKPSNGCFSILCEGVWIGVGTVVTS